MKCRPQRWCSILKSKHERNLLLTKSFGVPFLCGAFLLAYDIASAVFTDIHVTVGWKGNTVEMAGWVTCKGLFFMLMPLLMDPFKTCPESKFPSYWTKRIWNVLNTNRLASFSVWIIPLLLAEDDSLAHQGMS